MTSLRRSTRAHKQVESIYNSSEKGADEAGKRRKSKAGGDNDEEEEASAVCNEEEEQEPMDESSSEEEDDSDEEAEAPKPRRPSRKRKSSAAPPAREKKVPVRKEIDAAEPKKKRAPHPKAGGALNRRQAVVALTTLAKKVLTDPKETPEKSLTAALLLSFREESKNKKRTSTNSNSDESYYTTGIEAVARRVLEQHKDDARAVEVSLFNLILRSVGGTSLLEADADLEEMSDEDWSTKIEEVVEEMGDTAPDKVLLTANPTKASVGALEFRKIYSEFWYQLAATALAAAGSADGKSDRFQVEWVRDIVARLIELVGVGVPEIRFAFTTAIYQMGHAMLEHTAELRSKLETAERQLSVAARNNQSRKAEALEDQIDSWNRIVAELEEIVKETIMAVFTVRFKDVDSHVRVASLDALTKYCRSRPDIFVNSFYLKYFGWMLSDKAPNVRVAAIQGLIMPFKNKLETSGMTNVIAKFTGRLTDCVIDVDEQVQEVAMELLLILLREEHFNAEENERIWLQINSRALEPKTTPSVRRDALYFIIEQLDVFDEGPAKSEREAVTQLRTIAKWVASALSDGEIPIQCIRYDLADLIVSSFRDMPEYKNLVCNWAAMLRAFQGDERRKSISKGDQRQDTVTQRVMLRMLVTAVQLEVTDAAAVDKAILDPDLADARQAANESLQTTNKSKPSSSSREELTLALLRALPDLLVSFKSETSVLQCLTTLPQYFLPSVLNLSSRKKEFQSLVSNLSTIFLESTDPITLNNCCRAIVLLAKGGHSRSDDALLVLKETACTLRTRLINLFEVKAKCAENDDEDSDNEDEMTHTEISIRLCLLRLGVLAKRSSIARLVGDEESEDEELETISKAVANYLAAELKSRQIIYHHPETQGDMDQVEAPKIWSSADESVHYAVAGSLSEGLNFILATTSWRLNEEIQRIDKGEAEYKDEDIENHVVLRMRDRMQSLILLCYEQFIARSDLENFSEVHRKFSVAVQEQALRVSGDLRSLFPRKWLKAKSPFLSACALVGDSILAGAGIRFVRSQEFRIKDSEEGSDEKFQAIKSLLYPIARALSTNWESGNRREAGAALAHITGSGKEAHEFVLAMSRVFKKIGPVRLLEAHMACLRQDFEAWAESEPDEPSDRPTDAEMQEFEAQENLHRLQFESIQSQAARLSASLGVGKIHDKVLSLSLLGFVREGVRFAFSTDLGESDEPLPLGCRLSFLNILSKYLSWIRNNKEFKKILTEDLNEKEAELRNHPEFPEIYDVDKKALTEFRKMGDMDEYKVEDDASYAASQFSTTHGGSTAMKPRTSMGSSVSSIRSKISTQASLESIHEEDPSVENGGEDSDDEDVTRRSTPSPPKRRRTISSAHTETSGLTLDEADAHDSGDDDESTNLLMTQQSQ